MTKPPKSLKTRLTLWVFLPTVIISALDLIVTYENTDNIATIMQEQLLKGSANIISEQLATIEGGYEISVPPAAFELFANEYKDRVYYSVRSKSGLLIAGDEDLEIFPRKLKIEQEEYFMSTMRGERVRVIAYAEALPSTISSDYAITQVAQTLRGHNALRKRLFLSTMREHLILLSIVVLGLIIAFRWTLNPLIKFGKMLLQRQPGSLEPIDDANAPVELKPVIFAMNDYVARLDKTLTSYESFVANTAHQLRTSFAIITSQINFAQRNSVPDQAQNEMLQAIRKTVLQGTKVINQMLVLAAVEQNRLHPNSSNLVQVAEIIKGAIEELALLALQKDIDLGIDILDETIRVSAPNFLLRELIFNLIDNAIQHMKQEGVVTVSLQRKNNLGILSVIDNGPGIPVSERQKVFERFYRLDQTKPNSSGLGLSIVKEICDSLNADISLTTPKNEIGLQVDVAFPLETNGQ
jgi:two-component system sensor histidine kinase TctE